MKVFIRKELKSNYFQNKIMNIFFYMYKLPVTLNKIEISRNIVSVSEDVLRKNMYQILPINTLIPFILETLAIFSILRIIGYCIESKTSKNEEIKKRKNIKQIKTIIRLFVSFDPKRRVTLLTREIN